MRRQPFLVAIILILCVNAFAESKKNQASAEDFSQLTSEQRGERWETLAKAYSELNTGGDIETVKALTNSYLATGRSPASLPNDTEIKGQWKRYKEYFKKVLGAKQASMLADDDMTGSLRDLVDLEIVKLNYQLTTSGYDEKKTAGIRNAIAMARDENLLTDKKATDSRFELYLKMLVVKSQLDSLPAAAPASHEGE